MLNSSENPNFNMDKITIITKAVKDWENNAEHTNFGLCLYFDKTFGIPHNEVEYVFSEIYKKRTKGGSYPYTEHYWFNNRQERINALKDTLKEYLAK